MLRQMKTGMIFLSVGYLLVGLLLLVMPQESLRWICYAFGAVILITGAICLLRYFHIRGNGIRAPFLLIGGVVTLSLGIFLLLQPDFVMSILPVVFGLFIAVDGVLRCENSIELARLHGQRWWILLLLGAVSVLLGVLVVLHPLDAIIGVTMLSGLLLVVEGALNLGCVIYASMEVHALDRVAKALAGTQSEPVAAEGEVVSEQDTAAAPEPPQPDQGGTADPDLSGAGANPRP